MSQDYESALLESWKIYATTFEIISEEPNEAFKWVFKRAFQLGKQTETITQEEIEKASLKYILNRQQARHNAKSEEEVSLSDFDNTLKAWDAFDMAQAYEDGANFALGKQKKEEENITISKKEYEELCKCQQYMNKYVINIRKCPTCGEYLPSGYFCSNCE